MSHRGADLSNPTSQPSRPRGTRWSITLTLVWGFGSLVVAAAGIILFLGLGSGYQNTAELLTKNATMAVSSISQRILHQLEPARAQAMIVAKLITERRLDQDDPNAFASIMRASFAAAPQLAVVRFFGADGRSIRASRKDSGIAVDITTWRDDASLTEWLVQVQGIGKEQATDEGMWGDITFSRGIEQAVIFYRAPVIRDGASMGLVLAAVTTRELSQYLKELSESTDVSPFVLLGPEDVIAYSELATIAGVGNPDAPLLALEQLTDPVMKSIWNPETKEEVG